MHDVSRHCSVFVYATTASYCLTYLDYSNSNQQRKSHAKLDAKNTNGRQASMHDVSRHCSVFVYATTASYEYVVYH